MKYSKTIIETKQREREPVRSGSERGLCMDSHEHHDVLLQSQFPTRHCVGILVKEKGADIDVKRVEKPHGFDNASIMHALWVPDALTRNHFTTCRTNRKTQESAVCNDALAI